MYKIVQCELFVQVRCRCIWLWIIIKKSISNSKIKKSSSICCMMMESFWCFHGQTQNIFVHFEPHQHPHQDIQMSTYKSQHTQARSFYLFLKKSTVEQTPFPCLTFFFENNHNKTIDKCDDVYQKSNKAWNSSFLKMWKIVCVFLSHQNIKKTLLFVWMIGANEIHIII